MPTLNYSAVTGSGRGYTQITTPDGRSLTMRGDRAMRNNNPGNIEYGPYARSKGAIGTDGRFAVFPSRETGIKAQAGLLFGSKAYRGLTIAQAISKYAPPTENNTKAYAQTIADAIGVSVDTKLSDIPPEKQGAFLGAMQSVEGNTEVKGYNTLTGAHDYTIDGIPGPFSPARPDNRRTTPLNATPASVFSAYRNPTRALDVVSPNPIETAKVGVPFSIGSLPNKAMPSLTPAPLGKVTRGPALPAPLPAAPAGLVTRASLPPPTRALPPSRPAALAAAPVGRVERAPLAPPTAPVGAITRGPTPAVAAAIADAYASPSRALDTLQPGLSSYTGLSTGKTPDQQAIADQVTREQMATPPAPTLAEQLAAAPVAKAAPAPVLAPALAPPAAPKPALPAPRLAPPLAPPVNIPNLPVAPVQAMPPVAAPAQVSLGSFPSAPVSRPALAPSDIYGGMPGQAMSSSGNMVSGNGLGVTGVTNQFGATTGMKDGYQTALSGPLGITGPLDGQGIRTGFLDGLGGKLTSPAMGQAVKTGAMGAIGGGVGGLLGPVGALLGGALGRELAKPGGGAIGGLLSGTRSFDTDFFGNVRTTAPQRGAFPGAPQGAPGALSGRQSNNSAEGMRGISPGAADAIGRGLGGLY